VPKQTHAAQQKRFLRFVETHQQPILIYQHRCPISPYRIKKMFRAGVNGVTMAY
jgi:hypothetical protein